MQQYFGIKKEIKKVGHFIQIPASWMLETLNVSNFKSRYKNRVICFKLLKYLNESLSSKYEDMVNFAVIRPAFDRVSLFNWNSTPRDEGER